MAKIGAVIFDLDNVLYDEREYFVCAFGEVASFLSGLYGVSKEGIFERLLADFKAKSSMYPRLFNDLLEYYGFDQKLLPDVLKIFSNVKPNLRLIGDVEHVLLGLKQLGIKLALVTNGNVATQKNKVELLGVGRFFDCVIYAREMDGKEKPDPSSYLRVLNSLGVTAEEVVCVGDNPYTDFVGAKKLGIRTVRLISGEFKDVIVRADYEADATVNSLLELYSLVADFR